MSIFRRKKKPFASDLDGLIRRLRDIRKKAKRNIPVRLPDHKCRLHRPILTITVEVDKDTGLITMVGLIPFYAHLPRLEESK